MFQVLAALGLVLAAAQGGAWGGETIWTKATGLVRRVLECPTALPPLPACEECPDRLFFTCGFVLPRPKVTPPPLFAWEKRDAADAAFDLARACEITGDYEFAYLRYRVLARRYPSRHAFAVAADRTKGHKPSQPVRSSISARVNPEEDGEPSYCWFVDVRSFVMPERSDVLPDSECSRTLIELGIIDDLATYEPVGAAPTPGDHLPPGVAIIF